MTVSTDAGEAPRREFVDTDFRGARFVRSDLSGAVMRSVDVQGLEVDGPWLLEPGGSLVVNGVDTLPEGTVDVSVDDEFSFAQTLRHLVMATDVWLGRAILGKEQPFHPLGQPNAEYATDGYDTSVFTSRLPSYDEVLEVRAERMGMVCDAVAAATVDGLAETRANPWLPQHPETVLSCLHVILNEEWEHHRYAVRDLDALGGAS